MEFYTEAKRSVALLAIQHKHKKLSIKTKKLWKKLGEPKISYVSKKTIRGRAKTGGTILMFSEFVLLMRDKMRHFKVLTLPKTLIICLLKQVRVKIFEVLEFSQWHYFFLQRKIAGPTGKDFVDNSFFWIFHLNFDRMFLKKIQKSV